jgi:hypothetical protein
MLNAMASQLSGNPMRLWHWGRVPSNHRLSEGIVIPVDFTTPLESHLNLKAFARELKGYPDQELLSFLLEGVRYKADVDFQIVLLPHLISLASGYHSLKSEVDKYANKGWYGIFSHSPFLPFRAVPKGSTPRKLEPDRPRPITEAGAPRKKLLDSDGIEVISINETTGGKPPVQAAQARAKAASASSGNQPRKLDASLPATSVRKRV